VKAASQKREQRLRQRKLQPYTCACKRAYSHAQVSRASTGEERITQEPSEAAALKRGGSASPVPQETAALFFFKTKFEFGRLSIGVCVMVRGSGKCVGFRQGVVPSEAMQLYNPQRAAARLQQR